MATAIIWTMKRLENVVRLREYTELYHFEGEDGMTDNVRLTREEIIAIRDLPEYLIKRGIESFAEEESMELLAQAFA